MYNDFAHGLMFVVGTEDMSKSRFIFMWNTFLLVRVKAQYLSK